MATSFISVIRCNHDDAILGLVEYAMNPVVIKELGYPITSTSGQDWYMAIEYDTGIAKCHEVIGFASVKEKGNYVVFCHDYVNKDFRGRGIYSQLFAARYEHYKHKTIKAVCTNMSVRMYLKNGFKITKKTKNYVFVEHKAVSDGVNQAT